LRWARGRLVVEFLRESALLCAASAAPGYVIAATAIGRYAGAARLRVGRKQPLRYRRGSDSSWRL